PRARRRRPAQGVARQVALGHHHRGTSGLTAFVDSSALVTIYADTEVEVGLPPGPLVVSALARVEVASAAWTKQRTGELESVGAQVLSGEFEADSGRGRFTVIAVRDELRGAGARLTAIHGVRSLDAVHLATEMAARDADPTCTTFARRDD